MVVSDWWGTYQDVAAGGGLDMEMPGPPVHLGPGLADRVRAGELDEAVVEDKARRILMTMARFGFLDRPARGPDVQIADHRALARRAAVEGTVLLANDGLLPLDPVAIGRMAVIGRFAVEPRIQGRGSACVNPRSLTAALDALAADLGDRVVYAPGYPDHGDDADPALVHEAVELVRGSDVAVVVVGLPDLVESEGYDRVDLELPEQQVALLDAVAATGTPVVVVLVAGSAVRLGDWHDRASAVVLAWLAGQESGPALADVLLGRADPGGRLGETFPLRLEDSPAFLSREDRGEIRYSEGVFVGHRWYDGRRIDVRHPFGHGLSYATFAWSDLEVGPMDAATGQVPVSVTVTNTGARAGCDVVQVYVEPAAAPVARPVRELKGFQRVRLAPAQAVTITFRLHSDDLAFFGRDNAEIVEPGEFHLWVGGSSDAGLQGTFRLVAAGAAP